MASVVGQIVHKMPTPPRELNKAISPALEAVCLKALAKRAEERFASAGQMSQSLAIAIQETGEPPTGAAQSFFRKGRSFALVCSAVIAAGILSVGYWKTPAIGNGRAGAPLSVPWHFVESQLRRADENLPGLPRLNVEGD